MSRTTESFHVRGVRVERVRAAVNARLHTQGFVLVPAKESARVERTETNLVRIVLRRDGRWTSVADARGFSGLGRPADGDLEGWGRHVSRALDRSVLTIWTWDGESSVIATRYKRGETRASLELLQEAYRGDDGRPRAPAKVLWPWLPKKGRDAILHAGLLLADPPKGTGDAELDRLLADFEDVEVDDTLEEGEDIYVPLETSVDAIGAAGGMSRPRLDPWSLDDGDELLLFRRK